MLIEDLRARTGSRCLAAPTLEDARTALVRVHPAAGAERWRDLLAAAGLTGAETGRADLERLLSAMERSGDPATAVCARALRIRATTSDRLSPDRPAVEESPR